MFRCRKKTCSRWLQLYNKTSQLYIYIYYYIFIFKNIILAMRFLTCFLPISISILLLPTKKPAVLGFAPSGRDVVKPQEDFLFTSLGRIFLGGVISSRVFSVCYLLNRLFFFLWFLGSVWWMLMMYCIYIYIYYLIYIFTYLHTTVYTYIYIFVCNSMEDLLKNSLGLTKKATTFLF